MLLEVKHLHIEFHDHTVPETVVHDLNFAMEPGDIVGIVGESGSGKSMSALAIAGLLSRHDLEKQGQVLFEGMDTLSCSRKELRQVQGCDMGMIFQEPMTSLNPLKKIGWQVEESLRLHTALDRKARKKRALEALREAELSDPERVYNLYPHNLSGGMRQRVMIAAAIACHPKLLIADEPTTALDVTIQAQIVRLLQKFSREQGMAVLFISHDLSLVRQLCSRVLVMHQGYVAEQGTMEQVFEHPVHAYTKRLIASIPAVSGFEQQEDTEKSDSSSSKVLEVRHLNGYYREQTSSKSLIQRIRGEDSRKQVLKDISFSIEEGQTVGLVGESGCGKTTLSKALLGFLREKEGEICHSSSHPQMVFQDPYSSLNPSKTIGQIMEEPLKNNTGLSKEERAQRVREMLQNVGLDQETAVRYPHQLSGGQRQRVSIGTALMLSPKLLIADEPVSALDVTIQAQIMELFQKLCRELKLSVLFISHDLRVVSQVCDRVMIMKDGQIIEEGTVQDVYLHPKQEYTKLLLESAGL